MQGALIIQTLMKLPEEHNTIVVSRFVNQKLLSTFQYENMLLTLAFLQLFGTASSNYLSLDL